MSTVKSVEARTLFHINDWSIVSGQYVQYCYALHTGCKLDYDKTHPSDIHAMIPGRPAECGRCYTTVSDEIYAIVKLINWDNTNAQRWV